MNTRTREGEADAGASGVVGTLQMIISGDHLVTMKREGAVQVGEYQSVSNEAVAQDESELLEAADHTDSVGNSTGEGPPSKRPIQCEHCSLCLSNRQTYLKHLGRRHPEKQLDQLCHAVKKWYSCEEDGCGIKVRSREELLHHLGKDHEWEIKEVTGTFDTEDEFEIFFQRVQKMYKTRFVSRHGKVNGVKRFYCNREGAIRVKQDDRTRKHIKRGTSKIGTFCTAHAIVSYHTNGQVSIIGSVTHYNHELEGKYLPLLDSEKNFIRYHAQMGMNCREILEILHKTVGELDEDDPLRYVDYKTIRNTLERGKTLEQNRSHSDGDGSDPGHVRMLNKINNYPRPNGRPIDANGGKSNAENIERASTTFSDIVLEHTAATNSAFDIVQSDTHQWGVKRPEGKVRHRVVRVSDVCPSETRLGTQCELTCKLCQCCSHLYKCNCGGATKIGKMCKHIHAVVQFIRDCEVQQGIEVPQDEDKYVVHEMVGEEYSVAQEVEEEHGILDSYIDDGMNGGEENAAMKQDVTSVDETVYALQDESEETTADNDGSQVVAIIQEAPEEEQAQLGVNRSTITQGTTELFQTYEMLADGSTVSVANRSGPGITTTALPGEQRINPEFEQFLEQSTHLLNQLHQVSNPENILQACTIFQQLKILVMATETPKLIKG